MRWVALFVLFVPLVYCHLYGMNEGCFGEIDPTDGNFTQISCLDLDLDFDFDDEDHEHPTSSAADRVNGIYYIAARDPATVYGIHISNGSLYTTITFPKYVQGIQGLAYDPRSQKLIAQEVYKKSGSPDDITVSDITITDTVTDVRKTLIKGKPFNRSCLTNPICSVSASINSFSRKYFLPSTNNAATIKEQILVVHLDRAEYSNINLKHMGDLVEFSNVEWLPSISTFVSISSFESVESEYLDLITIDNDGEVIKESVFDKSEDFNHPLSATFNKDDNLYYVMTSTPDLTNFHLYSIDIETWNATVVPLEADTKVHFIQYFPETPEEVVVDDDTVGDGASFESDEESSAVSESGDGDDDGTTFISSSSDTHGGLFAFLIILLIAVVVIIIVAIGILFLAWRKGIIGNRVEMV
eukprot:TRINITY_DN11078_c0_g1_i1.p1 TRINITY_DN11078_c0_g1~~TRINITY_DN11078_c0_g1_i1.p1  ORF type:complete len:413 (-),score=88.38 TRINITY_DN11078_c0_g1_i1:93-1331(-)